LGPEEGNVMLRVRPANDNGLISQILSPRMNDQWVWTILHSPPVRTKTSLQFQGVRLETAPSGFNQVDRKRYVSTAISPHT